MGLIPGSGRSPGEGYGNLLQYSCLENLMAQGAWRAIIHRVAKSWAQLKWMNTHTRTHMLLEISLWKIIKLWYDIVVRQMVFTTRLTGFESWIHHFIGCMLFKKEKKKLYLLCCVWSLSGHAGFSQHYAGFLLRQDRLCSYGMRAQLLYSMWDLSSLIRNGTHIPRTVGQILKHWTTREILVLCSFSEIFLCFQKKE